ncbi:DUF4174 domain-containing protein [Paracoccus jeotgali]|uniref:DUF4174 domain-containing protein n=1 Tax=Paracoccus jeotgali TaxID=2065379 RepID=UPI0028B04EE9|nr:DUF4174 domain-containing protein [Paracoccus jeotgali]
MLCQNEVAMKHVLMMLAAAMMLGAMGPGRDDAPPRRVNPPSAAEVDAMQTPRAPEVRSDQTLITLDILDAAEVAPEDFMWLARPVVVFADTDADPAFVRQLQELRDRPAALVQRDVVVITDTDPANPSIWRRSLHPRGFSLVIMDKDGQVKQRKPQPWSVREISRAIDKFPLRLQEIGRAGLLR